MWIDLIFLGAAQYLGEPIKQLGFRPDNEDNWCNGKQAQYHVRVKGTKDNGNNQVKSVTSQRRFEDLICFFLF